FGACVTRAGLAIIPRAWQAGVGIELDLRGIIREQVGDACEGVSGTGETVGGEPDRPDLGPELEIMFAFDPAQRVDERNLVVRVGLRARVVSAVGADEAAELRRPGRGALARNARDRDRAGEAHRKGRQVDAGRLIHYAERAGLICVISDLK